VRVFFFFKGSTTGSLPFLLSRPMTRWIERWDEPADGTMNGAAAATVRWRRSCGRR
jgi:hypothetical protein